MPSLLHDWSGASTGRGAVSEGSTDIGYGSALRWRFVQSLSRYRLLNPMRSRHHHHRGSLFNLISTCRLYISFCARRVAGRGGSGGGGGISPLIDAVVVHSKPRASTAATIQLPQVANECLSILFITSITRGIKAEPNEENR